MASTALLLPLLLLLLMLRLAVVVVPESLLKRSMWTGLSGMTQVLQTGAAQSYQL